MDIGTRSKIVALTLAAVLFAGGLYGLMNARRFQLFGRIVPRVETNEKLVALTFDDGPSPVPTRETLEILDVAGVHATFFLVGRDIEAHPDAAKAIVAGGHQIGNHSYTHARLVFVTPDTVATEIERTNRAIRGVGFDGEILFRPPFGKKLFSLPRYLAKHDITSVTWDVEPESLAEVAGSTESIVEHVVSHARPGSIILLHPMRDERTTRDAIAPIIERLRADGYRFVTVSELLATSR